MYVHHEFLYLILTRQVERKEVRARPKKKKRQQKMHGHLPIYPLARGSVENADKAQNFLLRKSDELFYQT
jgi:hypothetical protein